MRLVIVIIVGIHGLIHLFGFLKAYEIIKFEGFNIPISKSMGLLWLLAFLFFFGTWIMLILRLEKWWIFSIIGIILSQLLIFGFWQDARFGTLMNVLILIPVLVNYGAYNFNHKVNYEALQMLQKGSSLYSATITEHDIVDLPEVVQKWLKNSGVLETELVQSVFLEQDLRMKLKPEHNKWIQGKAKQYFTTDPPAFNWSVQIKMNGLIPISGMDKCINGQGTMTMNLLSLIPIVKVKPEPNINQAALQRYLAEIIWFPAAALSPHIKWKSVDNFSAKAIMDYGGTQGDGVFYFDTAGNFEKFETLRFRDVKKDSIPTPWVAKALKLEVVNGIKIPVESEVSWELDAGTWTWLKIHIKKIAYNKTGFDI